MRAGVVVTAILRDISDRKKIEAALRRSERNSRQFAKTFVTSHEEERQYIAMEVHDRIAQNLTAALHQLQTLEAMPLKDTAAQQLVSRAMSLVRESIQESRNIIEDLHSPVLHDFGLIAVIDEELRNFQEATGCRAHLDARYPERLPRELEVTVHRIFREALTNVKRHAEAREVWVTLTHKKDQVDLQVKDNGQGFNPGAEMRIKQVGGLMIMRRRAELSGGTFEVRSAPGKGTTVSVSFPCNPRNLPPEFEI